MIDKGKNVYRVTLARQAQETAFFLFGNNPDDAIDDLTNKYINQDGWRLKAMKLCPNYWENIDKMA